MSDENVCDPVTIDVSWLAGVICLAGHYLLWSLLLVDIWRYHAKRSFVVSGDRCCEFPIQNDMMSHQGNATLPSDQFQSGWQKDHSILEMPDLVHKL